MSVSRTVTSVNEALTTPSKRQYQFPVKYVYDYMDGATSYLRPAVLSLNNLPPAKRYLQSDNCDANARSEHEHGIDIDPLSANLPWASGVLLCGQSKYWESCIAVTKNLLEHFAVDDSVHHIYKSGMSIADISKLELANNVEEGWAKFTPYFFVGVNEERIKLLAALMVFIFVFDDFWEMHDIASFNKVHTEFISRMAPSFTPSDDKKSPLITLIDQVIQDIKDLDRQSGNTAGCHMLNTMVDFFARGPPEPEYKDLRAFMVYRHLDAAADFVLTCIAFGLNLSIDINSPRLTRYLLLWRDHVSIVNDLGSWDKEKRAYDTGNVLYLINTVDAITNLLQLGSDNAALAISYALQLQAETEIDDEIKRLVAEGSLSTEEWRFIYATIYAMGGNVLGSIVMSRYGGEPTRLPEQTT